MHLHLQDGSTSKEGACLITRTMAHRLLVRKPPEQHLAALAKRKTPTKRGSPRSNQPTVNWKSYLMILFALASARPHHHQRIWLVINDTDFLVPQNSRKHNRLSDPAFQSSRSSNFPCCAPCFFDIGQDQDLVCHGETRSRSSGDPGRASGR